MNEAFKSPKLTIELIPEGAWYNNIRSVLPVEAWDIIRKLVYKTAGYRCRICKGKGLYHPVEAHEVWEFFDLVSEGNPTAHLQVLQDIMALCSACHQVKHIGYARNNGKFEEALEHLARINDWSREITEEYVKEKFYEHGKKSEFKYELDLSYLEDEFTFYTQEEKDVFGDPLWNPRNYDYFQPKNLPKSPLKFFTNFPKKKLNK